MPYIDVEYSKKSAALLTDVIQRTMDTLNIIEFTPSREDIKQFDKWLDEHTEEEYTLVRKLVAACTAMVIRQQIAESMEAFFSPDEYETDSMQETIN